MVFTSASPDDSFYMKMYFNMKRIASMYIVGVSFLHFPHKSSWSRCRGRLLQASSDPYPASGKLDILSLGRYRHKYSCRYGCDSAVFFVLSLITTEETVVHKLHCLFRHLQIISQMRRVRSEGNQQNRQPRGHSRVQERAFLRQEREARS